MSSRSRQRRPPSLFAHCLTSPRQCHLQADDRRPKAIAHADRVAEAVQLDVAESGLAPTVATYQARVTKARISRCKHCQRAAQR